MSEFEKSSIRVKASNDGWTKTATAKSVVASPERKTIQGERSEEVFHTAKMTEVFPIADVINSIMLIAQMKTMNYGETFWCWNTARSRQVFLSSAMEQLLCMLISVLEFSLKLDQSCVGRISLTDAVFCLK